MKWLFERLEIFSYFFIVLFNNRQLLKYLDDSLGEPIPEKDYGGNCRIYDWEKPSNPFHNVIEKIDVFIFAHSFGYWCKTLIFRDWWLTTVISVMFEFLEYSLEHQVKFFFSNLSPLKDQHIYASLDPIFTVAQFLWVLVGPLDIRCFNM